MIKMKKKMEILIKNEGNTWPSFRVFKCWLKISDNHTIVLAACMCVYSPVYVSPYITSR